MTLTGVRADAMKGKLEPAVVHFDGTLANDQFSGRLSVDQKPLRTITITANLPLDADKVIRDPKSLMDSEIDAHVVLPESDLSIVKRFVPSIAALNGRVAADVKISGPVHAPHWEGVAHAEAPSMTFEKTPMDVKNLKVRISFQDKQIKVDEMSVMLAGGDLRVTGGVDVTELKKPMVDLRLDASQALVVRNEQYSARADGAITAKGTMDKAEIAGRVELVRARVFKEIEFLPLSLPGDRLPPPPPAVTVRKPPSLPPPMNGWTFDVDIVTRDPIRLLGNVMNGSATSHLKFSGTGAVPTLEGEVGFEGTRVRLPNSRLTVSRGRLIFTKDKPFEPELDLRAESLVSNYEVTVNAYGSAFKPKVRFTSSPPLPENEVALLLATGSTAGGADAIAGAAANTAAFEVLKKAYRGVFDKAAPKRYDDDPPRFTFSLSPVTQGVSANYQISDRMQLTGETTERGTFRGMLYYMVRMR
jgi:autotransporter translocation and assembly factor TamB